MLETPLNLPTPTSPPLKALHTESAASSQQLMELQATLKAKEAECAAGGRRVEDLEMQCQLLRRGREEDAHELGRLKAEVCATEIKYLCVCGGSVRLVYLSLTHAKT